MSGWLDEAHSDDSELTDESDHEPMVTVRPRRHVFDDESDEETKRVVKTARQKYWESMTDLCKTIKNHIRIKDFSRLLEDFDSLNQQLARNAGIVASEGVPVFYIRAIVRLEDTVSVVTKEEQKKMGKNAATSFNKLRMGLKKNAKNYETELANFRANPVESEEEVESDSEGDAKPVAGSDEESDWDDDEDSDDEEIDRRTYDPNNPRKFWELKPGQTQDD
jgi:translation initiation factor 3 subunit C